MKRSERPPLTTPLSLRPVPGGRPPKLGPYEVMGKIAKGGMATIYLARHRVAEENKFAALKVIRYELSNDDKFVKMLLDEGTLLGRLVHPNIVRTFDVGVEGEQRYIAMELMLGHTLLEVWKACAARSVGIAPEVIAWLGARVAQALHFAHELADDNGEPLNVIHRDVNPANIFLTYEGSLKLFDFGLAKSEGRRSGSDPRIVKGKLPYLSPEQIMQLPLDRRCDIFALGTTLWEMATMRQLFTRDSDVDTVKAVRGGPIPDPREHAPELPVELATIIVRALERNRVHRYQTAAALAEDLDAFVRASGANDVPARVAAVQRKFFPEEYARQMNWVRRASR